MRSRAGVDAANDAANRAAIAGLPPGVPLYFDMEAYNTADAGCSLAVKQFIGGWVARLHERGFAAGFYSSLNSGIADMAKAVNEGYPALDAIWIAAWNDTPNIFGFGRTCFPTTSGRSTSGSTSTAAATTRPGAGSRSTSTRTRSTVPSPPDPPGVPTQSLARG